MSTTEARDRAETIRTRPFVRFRHRIKTGVMDTYAWRFGLFSGLHVAFEFGGRVDSLHVGRVSIARGGEDPISEGFVDGVKAKWLKSSYPQVVVAWWPKDADKRGHAMSVRLWLFGRYVELDRRGLAGWGRKLSASTIVFGLEVRP